MTNVEEQMNAYLAKADQISTDLAKPEILAKATEVAGFYTLLPRATQQALGRIVDAARTDAANLAELIENEATNFATAAQTGAKHFINLVKEYHGLVADAKKYKDMQERLTEAHARLTAWTEPDYGAIDPL